MWRRAITALQHAGLSVIDSDQRKYAGRSDDILVDLPRRNKIEERGASHGTRGIGAIVPSQGD
jgi:hypothetical protein